jgi:hypothetical protein
MKIQIIGYPCAGKSTAIREYVKKNPNIKYIDIREFQKNNQHALYNQTLKKSRGPIIAESACGIPLRDSVVVRLDIDMEHIYSRFLQRERILDEDYLSLLETQMIPTHYTVKDPETLSVLLDALFNRT